MPWYNGDYPPSYKNQPPALRNKAVEIANELLGQGLEEGVAIATGLKRARLALNKEEKMETKTKTGESKNTERKKSTDKQLKEFYDDYQEFQLKKRQYGKALHHFYDHTNEYNAVIDQLPVKEMDAWRRAFIQREREFHDVMDSFDRALEQYTQSLEIVKPKLKGSPSLRLKNKTVSFHLRKDEVEVTEKPD